MGSPERTPMTNGRVLHVFEARLSNDGVEPLPQLQICTHAAECAEKGCLQSVPGGMRRMTVETRAIRFLQGDDATWTYEAD